MSRTPIQDRIKPAALVLAMAVAATFGSKLHAENIRTTVVAGGCFWCVEADFEKVDGVVEVVSGFAGGTVANPTYRQVVSGGTGHYEVVEITYDTDILPYERLVNLFLRSVDPTDAGGQFCDRGQSYATAIFVETPAERQAAEAQVALAEADLGQTIVTPVLDTTPFYPAEDYHQDYYRSQDIILTRFGPRRKEVAYGLYRTACGRDARVLELWGDAAPFAGANRS